MKITEQYMKITEQQQIQNWANIYNDTFVNESLSKEDLKELDEMIKFCDKQESKYHTDKARFQEFAFEGQALRNVWYALKTACELLKDNREAEQVLRYLGNAMTQLSDVDGHKRPIPTDPRDIK